MPTINEVIELKIARHKEEIKTQIKEEIKEWIRYETEIALTKKIKTKLEQFLEWLKEEDPYPLLDHNDLIVALEEYEAEVKTSSEKEVNVL